MSNSCPYFREKYQNLKKAIFYNYRNKLVNSKFNDLDKLYYEYLKNNETVWCCKVRVRASKIFLLCSNKTSAAINNQAHFQ